MSYGVSDVAAPAPTRVVSHVNPEPTGFGSGDGSDVPDFTTAPIV